jgi:hypothetical protein
MTHPSSSRAAQRGEGKIGCILSLLVLAAALGTAYKAVPVLYTDNELKNFAGELAVQAGITPPETLLAELQNKAKELDIPEALAPGALDVTSGGERKSGVCTVSIKYTRIVDLYGIYPLAITNEKTITTPYMDAR